MKTKFLLAAMLVLSLSIGSAYAGTTKVEANKTEMIGGNGKPIQIHKHHHRKLHRHHHVIVKHR
jgi:hypothetical protein